MDVDLESQREGHGEETTCPDDGRDQWPLSVVMLLQIRSRFPR